MTDQTPRRRAPQSGPQQRKQMLLRLDPAVHDALARWASDELRSANAQIEFLLRRALAEASTAARRRGADPAPRTPAEGAGPR